MGDTPADTQGKPAVLIIGGLGTHSSNLFVVPLAYHRNDQSVNPQD